jgi:cell division protein FtsZ
MVDEKLEDQVWVTVVATGFGDQPRRRREEDPFAAHPRVDERPTQRPADPEPRRALREPSGEPRVSRVRRPALDLDVPEFIPRR